MTVDTTIPHGEPGVADHREEIFGGPTEAMFGDMPVQTINVDITAAGADRTLALYSVLSGEADGILADWNASRDAGSADFILATAVTIADGETATVPVYVQGHFNMDALVWDASYDTDAKKKDAFVGGDYPMLLCSKPEHDADAIFS